MYKKILYSFACILFSINTWSKDCSSVLKLSQVSSSTSLNYDTFVDRAEKFCDEYSKQKQKGTQGSLSISYADIGVGASNGSSNVDATASKYCKSDKSKEINTSAYESFSNSIAPLGFDAYQACLRSGEEGLDFSVTGGLEKEATLALSFNSKQKDGVADMTIIPSDSISCKVSLGTRKSSNKLIFRMIDNTTAVVNCTRRNSQNGGVINIIRTNTGSEPSIGVPWTAYRKGVPVSLVKEYEEAVAFHNDLALKVQSVNEQLNRIIQETNSLKSDIVSMKNPTSCRWLGVTNQSGGHGAAIEGKKWIKSCPNGSYVKSYKLQTYGKLSTYHHAIECCSL